MSIFLAKRSQNGFDYTIVSKLGEILKLAESKYGERDKSYTILGIEYNQLKHPQIWFPGNRKDVVIQITENCLDNIEMAVFQVAHEAIHCLSPTGKNDVNILEEGLATLFSFNYSHGDNNLSSNDQKYLDAYELVKELLSFDDEIIKKLRVVQPMISLINKELILEINPNVPIALAEKLTTTF